MTNDKNLDFFRSPLPKVVSEQDAHNYCNRAISLETGIRGAYLRMGEMLYNIREEKLYEPFWSSWGEYCMEFKDMSEGSISKVILVYERFVLRFGFSPEKLLLAGGWTKLYEIAKVAQTKKQAESWLKKAETFSRADLGKMIVEVKTGVRMDTCKHSDAYLIRVCPDCGLKERVYDEK